MGLSLITKPTFTPIGLNEVKDRLRITNEDEDAMLLSMIHSATEWAERILSHRLCTQTWKLFLDTWPTEAIRIPYPPLQSITHIKYYDSSNVQQTVTSTDYDVDAVSFPAMVKTFNTWPSHYDRMNPIEIQFICGYASSDLIQEDIKDAVYLRVADLYEHRQNTWVTTGISSSIIENTETSYNILIKYKLFNEP